MGSHRCPDPVYIRLYRFLVGANARELVFTAPEAPRETGSTNSRFNLLSKEVSQFTDEMNLDFFNLTT